jgi:hypothetical protein
VIVLHARDDRLAEWGTPRRGDRRSRVGKADVSDPLATILGIGARLAVRFTTMEHTSGILRANSGFRL